MSKIYNFPLNGVNRRSEYFIEKIACNHRLICPICCDILIDPYQTQCGCRFCYKCISDYFDINSTICPECKTEISVDIIKDRAVEREILNLEVRCLNNGCNNICEFKHLNNHLENCEWRQEICDKCQNSFSYNLKNKHLKDLCLKTICKCNYCNEEMTRMEYQSIHINPFNEDTSKLCENLMIECPYKCKTEICDIKNHLTKCPNKIRKCTLFHFGCEFLGNNAEIASHMEQNCANHLLLTISEIHKLKKENSDIKKSLEINETIELLKQENLNLKSELKKLEMSFNESVNEIDIIKSEITNYKNLIGIEEIDNDLRLINGVCIWTIGNIERKINDAKLGVNVQITSKSFYLNEPGYRFALKIYPNGDGQGKGCFLSIFFILFKGEFDDELDWPFQNRVSLSLISNDRSERDISIYMKPDKNINCYGKPVNDFNLGAGQPEFVNLTTLLHRNTFIQDGSIKIRFEMKSERNTEIRGNVVLQGIKKVK